MDWWNSLTGLQRIFASIAIPTTMVMVFQFIMLLLGMSHDGGADGADSHIDMGGHEGGDHDIFSGHTHEVFDGHSHEVFDGHSHDVPDVHIHEGLDGHAEECTGHHAGEVHENTVPLRLFTLKGIIAFLAIGGWTGVAAVSWKVPTAAVFTLAFLAGFLALYFVAWSIQLALRMQYSGNIIIDNAVGRQGEVYIPVPALRKGIGKVNVIVQERLCEFEAVTDSERTLKTGEKITIMGVASEGVLLVSPQDNPPQGVIKKDL